MRSRSLVVILVMGIGAVAAFGLLTKFAFENNSELKRTAEFKVLLMDAFEPRGIQGVSFRWLPGGGTVLLRLVADQTRVESAEFLFPDVAEFYVKHFPHERSPLRISLVPPSHLGCGEPSPFLEREVRPQAVRAAMVERDRRRQLARELESSGDLRLRTLKRTGRGILVTATLEASGEPDTDHDEVLARAARAVLKCYRLSPLGRLRIRLLAAPGSAGSVESEPAPAPLEPSVLGEATFDSRGRRVQR